MRKSIIILTELIFLTIIISFFAFFLSYFDKKTIDYSIIILLLYTLILYSHFFLFYPHKYYKNKTNLKKIESISQLKKLDLIISSTKHKTTYPQPINIIIITNKKIKRIMERNSWTECLTFSKNNIRGAVFLTKLIAKCPPMTDAYFQKNAQDHAFQSNAKFHARDHIRFWELGKIDGKTIYLGSISKDTYFSIRKHNGWYTPSHAIDKNMDKIRNTFTEELRSHFPAAKITKEKIGEEITKEQKNYYHTDGQIIIINI